MSKWREMLLERVSESTIIDSAEGINGLLAVTEDVVYLVRGGFMERKTIKSYALRSVSSVELKKPNPLFNGHIQVIASGNGDRTKWNSSAFSYAMDENTIMLRAEHYEWFVALEQLIYKRRDRAIPTAIITQESDVFDKIEKLAKLKEQRLISEAEYEEKRAKLLAEI